MGTEKYQALLQAAELGSITRAAEALGYTQSAVSRIVADLEQEWGLPLLIRGRSGVVPTSAGAELLAHVRAVCNAERKLTEAVAQLHGLTIGTIRVGAFSSISVHWLPQMIKDFLKQHPGVRFEVETNIEYREIEEWVATGHVDCGFIALPSALELDAVALHREQHMAVLPADHPLADATCYPLERITQDDYIKLEDDRDREVARIFDRYGLRPELRYQVDNDYSAMAMVESGLGVTVLPALILRRIPYRVVTKPLDPPQFREIAVAVRRRGELAPAVARFLEHVTHWVAENV